MWTSWLVMIVNSMMPIICLISFIAGLTLGILLCAFVRYVSRNSSCGRLRVRVSELESELDLSKKHNTILKREIYKLARFDMDNTL